MRRKTLPALLLAVCLLLSGCSGSAEPWKGGIPQRQLDAARDPDFVPYEAPPFAESAYHPELAEGNAAARVDLSAVGEGYVAVSAVSSKRLKFQVIKDENTYNYDLASDGTPAIFPLQCGDGSYTFRVMENVSDNKYAPLYTTECRVTLLDEFQPFLRPSAYVSYSAESACIKKAAELAAGCEDKLDVVRAVYHCICGGVSYDREKAQTVRSGYLPNPDDTLTTGKGICFDYAALTAAMLRSQGIPTKLITGFVAPNDLYHAWNMFYTEESGWVTVSFEVSEDSWNRLDLTFSAGGAGAEFIGDGSHYTDLYVY